MRAPLTIEDLQYIDRYIKKTISNVKRDFYRSLKKSDTQDSLNIDQIANDSSCVETIEEPPIEIKPAQTKSNNCHEEEYAAWREKVSCLLQMSSQRRGIKRK